MYVLFSGLVSGMLAENEVMEMATAGASDVQDDFRSAKFKTVKRYSEDNLKKSLFGKRESVSGTEGILLLQEYLNNITEDIVLLKPKKDSKYNGYLRKIYKAKASDKEKIYYFAFNSNYHSSYYCSHLPSNKGEVKIYSSMEECALSGFFPCKKCVLGLEK